MRRRARLKLADFPDLRGGFEPELAISLLIRSQRRPVGGRTVTDFEMWLHPSTDAAVPRAAHLVRLRRPRLEPGVRVGARLRRRHRHVERARSRREPDAVPTTERGDAARSVATRPDGVPDLVFGPPYDTRLVVRDLGLEVRLREAGRAQRRG